MIKSGFASLVALITIAACARSVPGAPEAEPVATLRSADASIGTGVGNGGGIIIRDGNVLTVTQAGIKTDISIEPVVADDPDQSNQIENEIGIVEKLVRRLAVDDLTKEEMLSGILPTDDRRYFIVKDSDLDPKKKKQLLAAYDSLLGSDSSSAQQIDLAAVTIGHETFILPNYFKLSDGQAKAAIIYHESLWVQNPRLKLSIVLNAESAFEKYIRSAEGSDTGLAYDYRLFESIMLAFDNPYLDVVGAARKDLEGGSIVVKFPKPDGSYTTNERKKYEIFLKRNSRAPNGVRNVGHRRGNPSEPRSAFGVLPRFFEAESKLTVGEGIIQTSAGNRTFRSINLLYAFHLCGCRN